MHLSYLRDFLDHHLVGGKTEGKKNRSVYRTNKRERLTEEQESSLRKKRCSWLQFPCDLVSSHSSLGAYATVCNEYMYLWFYKRLIPCHICGCDDHMHSLSLHGNGGF